jgi:hypothetical protein
MPDIGTADLLMRISQIEAELATVRVDLAIHRAALVWTMGVHQLSADDKNPHRAVLDALGLNLAFDRVSPVIEGLDPVQVAQKAKAFTEDAEAVFRTRNPVA